MTIEERKNRVFKCLTTGLDPDNAQELSDHAMKLTLDALLHQVAKEQRELCAEQVHLPVDVEQGDEMSIMCDVQNAPSPLKKETS